MKTTLLAALPSAAAFTATVALLVPAIASAKGTACPDAVTAAIAKAHPDDKTTSCKQETEDGKLQYEAKVSTRDGRKLEVDVSPEGAILMTEEPVALATVPKTVLDAFAAKYPGVTATKAEKQTDSSGKSTYELAFTDHGKRQESTFDDSGKFVEEE